MSARPRPSPTSDPAPPITGPSPERFEAILSSISDGVFTIDANGRITCFNRAAERITGFSREEAVGRPCHSIFRSDVCKDACPLRYTIDTHEPVVDLMIEIRTAREELVPVSISTAPFRDKEGNVVGGVETFRDLSQVEALRKQIEQSYSFCDIVSKSHTMRRVFDLLPTISGSDSAVLVTGESGTGKELVARAIHDLSHRSAGPFVAINSAGIPDTLLEAELFGYEAGAFTGALKSKPGRFDRAERGTLFLDEIGDLSGQLQAKLLRVLQDHTFEPLGGVRPKKADVRIVTATNRDLDEMVRLGTFRRDLYYRIKVFQLKLPPLRERMEDVPLLVDHFMRCLSARRGKAHPDQVSPEALKMLMCYDFPGNVRELENAVEHAYVLCPARMIRAEHLPEWMWPSSSISPPGKTLEDLERQFIEEVLRRNGYNRLAAARELGIHKSTFFRKIRKLGIELPRSDGRSSR
jgi:PAS domain S-box-containing protein